MPIELIDDDEGTLRAVNGEHVVKSWTYTDSTLRAVYREARAFCEGWHAALMNVVMDNPEIAIREWLVNVALAHDDDTPEDVA